MFLVSSVVCRHVHVFLLGMCNNTLHSNRGTLLWLVSMYRCEMQTCEQGVPDECGAIERSYDHVTIAVLLIPPSPHHPDYIIRHLFDTQLRGKNSLCI